MELVHIQIDTMVADRMVCHFFGYKKALKTVWLRALSGAARSGIEEHYDRGKCSKERSFSVLTFPTDHLLTTFSSVFTYENYLISYSNFTVIVAVLFLELVSKAPSYE